MTNNRTDNEETRYSSVTQLFDSLMLQNTHYSCKAYICVCSLVMFGFFLFLCQQVKGHPPSDLRFAKPVAIPYTVH